MEERREELLERNSLLQHEYEKEKEHRIIEEQNRLYDLLQHKTQNQIDRIADLAQTWTITDSGAGRKKLLAHIVVLGTFVKRRKDFILHTDSSDNMPVSMLSNALSESFQALRLFHIRGGFWIGIKEENMESTVLSPAYDFFEQVIEAVLPDIHFINVRICTVNNLLRMNILTDYEDEVPFLSDRFPTSHIQRESDGTEFILPLKVGI